MSTVMDIAFNRNHLKGFISEKDFDGIASSVKKAHHSLNEKTGQGREWTGWISLPATIKDSFLNELKKFAENVRKTSDCLVSIGIGGSYLGVRATSEFLKEDKLFPIYYAGHNLDVEYLYTLLDGLKKKRPSVVVISKSGTTTEPAIAFRIVKKILQERFAANELKKRIVCVTDEKKGALLRIAQKEGYRTFVIPDDVGGRFSVLTAVGLVPLAVAGIDISGLVEGARLAQEELSRDNFEKNIAYQYAGARYLLYKQGKVIEVLSSFYDRLYYIGEWWKQLFGESEGKDKKGIFPTALTLTTDLHSMGQLLQEGVRNIFETFLVVDRPNHKVSIPLDKDNLDNLNYVAGKDIDFINKQAYAATASAHLEGGVPNMTITIPKTTAFALGELFYFFEMAVALSGYLLGVNPFDQPGVEAYKRKMFELLGKK